LPSIAMTNSKEIVRFGIEKGWYIAPLH
jgi:hypothetical protein